MGNPDGPNRAPAAAPSAAKDVGRIFIVAVVLDTGYQLMVLRAFHPLQLLLIAVGCAIMPYLLIRGPVTRLTRGLYNNQARSAGQPAVNTKEETEPRAEK